MANEFVPPDFDAAAVLAGLRTAMGFGAPTRVEDQATFFLPVTVDPGYVGDNGGVPFDPTVKRSTAPNKKVVPCAVEFYAGGHLVERVGTMNADRIKVTLLDPDYQQVADFLYVVAGGDKYIRSKVEPPVALGSIDVWTCWADSESER
jgi:hypothetical protein